MPQLTEFTDEELETVEETTMERLWGLTEMIPESAYSVTNTTYAGGKVVSCLYMVAYLSKHDLITSMLLRVDPNRVLLPAACSCLDFNTDAILKFVRSSIWIVSTSLIVLALPAALEAERVNMEISREQEQRQALFGAQQPPM